MRESICPLTYCKFSSQNLFGAPTCACTQNGQLTQGSKDLVTTRIGILGSLLGTVSAGTVNNLLLSAVSGGSRLRSLVAQFVCLITTLSLQILGSGSQTSSCGSGAAVNQRRSLPKRCPTGQRACAISTAPSLANVFDCIDTTSDIESCGGCAYPARGEVAGQDCTSLPFVDVVECVAGGCLISSCQRGYALSSNGTCIPSLSKAALVYQS